MQKRYTGGEEISLWCVRDAFRDTWALLSAAGTQDQLTLSVLLLKSIKTCVLMQEVQVPLLCQRFLSGEPPSHPPTHTRTDTHKPPKTKEARQREENKRTNCRERQKKKMRWENLICVRSWWCVCGVCACVCVRVRTFRFLHPIRKFHCKSAPSWVAEGEPLMISFPWFTENVTCRQKHFFTSLLLDRWLQSWFLNGNDTTYGITWSNLQERAASQQQLLLRSLWEFPHWQTSFPLHAGS